jgi:pyruvate kinase
LDTRGPEIRTGKLQKDHSGHETIHLETGNIITLRTNPEWAETGSTETDLFIDYDHLHKCLHPGMRVLLDDGAITLTVQSVEGGKEYHGSVTCTIENSGELRSRAGVNLPGATTDLPPMSEKDKVDIRYGMTKDVDFVAASFIQNADGVREIRRYIQDCARELKWEQGSPLPLIISKIESMSALANFDGILEASDGIMVARGDLGVELPIQQVTNAQKEMVAACNAVGKPVIVATQMLESMAKSPRPTRAEVADVTNAVYDGADCVMLSGETAKGKYPVQSVQMMSEIIFSAEGYSRSGGFGSLHARTAAYVGPKTPNGAIAKAAVAAAGERGAAAILVLTNHGALPPLVSAHRPNVPILAFCPSPKVGRQLMLHRGVHPIVGLEGVSLSKRPEMAVQNAKSMGFVQSGDHVVIVTNEDFYEGLERTATMKIAVVP